MTVKKEFDVEIMTPMFNEKKTQLLEVFELSAGNISVCCKKMQISRETFYRWRREDKEFDTACNDIKESMIDMAETMLYKAIKEGKTAELLFFLKTQGQSRGYIEKQTFGIDTNEHLGIFTNVVYKEQLLLKETD